mgnify:CR=1 FL=1
MSLLLLTYPWPIEVCNCICNFVQIYLFILIYICLIIRYVEENSNEKFLVFYIPSNGCGTQQLETDDVSKHFENIIIIQNHPIYQQLEDSARLLSCRYLLEQDEPLREKKAVFKPFFVDTLDVITVSVIRSKGRQINSLLY